MMILLCIAFMAYIGSGKASSAAIVCSALVTEQKGHSLGASLIFDSLDHTWPGYLCSLIFFSCTIERLSLGQLVDCLVEAHLRLYSRENEIEKFDNEKYSRSPPFCCVECTIRRTSLGICCWIESLVCLHHSIAATWNYPHAYNILRDSVTTTSVLGRTSSIASLMRGGHAACC